MKGWIDPVTRSKIHVVKGDPRETLLAHIDASQLPAEYGGTCNTCPNSPDCCRAYPLSAFVELLPLRESDLADILVHETIKSGKHVKATVDLAAGEVAEWFWTLKDKEDIDWSVEFVPNDPTFKVRTHARAHATQQSGTEHSGSQRSRAETTSRRTPHRVLPAGGRERSGERVSRWTLEWRRMDSAIAARVALLCAGLDGRESMCAAC